MFSKDGQFVYGTKPVSLHGISWFGFNNGQTMLDGMWNYDPMSSDFANAVWRLKALGFNAVRLPFSFKDLAIQSPKSFAFDTGKLPTANELVASVTPPGGMPQAYQPLPYPVQRNGTKCNDYLPSTSVFDRFVYVCNFFANNGFFVLIDNHLREDQTAINDRPAWLAGYKKLVTALCADKITAGRLMVDILNEPDAFGLKWQGSTPCMQDLYLEAMDAIESVAKVQFIVEGCGQSALQSNWGDGFCTDAVTISQLSLSDPNPFFKAIETKTYHNRVGLGPHVYGPAVTNNTAASSGPALTTRLNLSFGMKNKSGYDGHVYPVLIGEFGSKFVDPLDKQTMVDLAAYLLNIKQPDSRHNPITNWFYWCWNADSGDTGGLVADDWKTIQWQKLAYLKGLGL